VLAFAATVIVGVAAIAAFTFVGNVSQSGRSPTTTQTATTNQQSVTSSSSTSATSATTSAPYCLLSIPADAQIGNFWNSTFNGNVVTYSNGTRALFSDYSCPRPVYGETSNAPPLQYYNFTTNIYAMAAAAERNSSFVAAENGSEFLFGSTSGLG